MRHAEVTKYLAKNGGKGGNSRSLAKRKASRKNLARARRAKKEGK
jgi:hypothetical protein